MTSYLNNRNFQTAHDLMKFLASFIVAFVCLWGATPCMATNYNCKMEQALVWRQGKLQKDDFIKSATVAFNDQDGVMSLAVNSGEPTKYSLTIIQNASHADLVAALTVRGEKDNAYLGNILLNVREWENINRVTYILYSNEPEVAVMAGSCLSSR